MKKPIPEQENDIVIWIRSRWNNKSMRSFQFDKLVDLMHDSSIR
jgi:hypothetical protein